jgi:hypothetical protein
MKLYEIPIALRRIEEQIADADGEITPDIDAQLSALEGELERKLEWIALMAREAQAEGDVYGAEIVRLAARKKAAENRAASLKAYAMEVMQQTGREKVKGELASLAVVRNSAPSLTVTVAPELLPERFRRVTVAPHLQAIRDAVKAGETVEGVEIEQGYHVRIR